MTIRRPVERIVPQVARPPMRAGLHVDPRGFVCVDGIRVARLVERNGTRMLQFRDHCKPRVKKRGTRYVEVPVREVARLEAGADGGTMREGEDDAGVSPESRTDDS